LGDSRPLNACAHKRDPKNPPTLVKPRRLSHQACLCDARFDRCPITRKKYRKISKEKSQSRCISCSRGTAPGQPIAMEVCTIVKVTNIINHANFGGLVSAKSQILDFPHTASRHGPSYIALRYRAGIIIVCDTSSIQAYFWCCCSVIAFVL
jgi:hypothetical protein